MEETFFVNIVFLITYRAGRYRHNNKPIRLSLLLQVQ